MFYRKIYTFLVIGFLATATFAFNGGEGTVGSPYEIATAKDLIEFQQKVNAGNSSLCGVLTADIVLNDTSDFENWQTEAPAKEWIPIGSATTPYLGIFNGDGHSISGLYIDTVLVVNRDSGNTFLDSSIGLFSQVGSTGILENLNITKAYVSVNTETIMDNAVCEAKETNDFKTSINVGVLVGKNQGIIRNNNVSNSLLTGITSQFYRAGSIAGRNEGILLYCNNYAAVSIYRSGNAWVNAGGIVGNDAGDVGFCNNYGDIFSENTVGGIAGLLTFNGRLFSSANYGTVTSQRSSTAYIGGVVGKANSGIIDKVYNRGKVVVNNASGVILGGIVGELGKTADSAVTLINVYNTQVELLVEGSTGVNIKGTIVGRIMSSAAFIDSAYSIPIKNINSVGRNDYDNPIIGEAVLQMDSTDMKSSDFATLLGEGFEYKSDENDGYPILIFTEEKAVIFVEGTNIIDVDEVVKGTLYTLPEATELKGHTFISWYREGEEFGTPGDTFTINEDYIFFAKYEAIKSIQPIAIMQTLHISGQSLSILFENAKIGSNLQIFNAKGHLLQQSTVNSNSFTMTMPSAGIYFVRLGNAIHRISLVP